MTSPDYQFMARTLIQAGTIICERCDKSASALQTRHAIPCDKGQDGNICPVKEIFHKADLIAATTLGAR